MVTAPSPRRNGLERRDALLDAALRCFSTKGLVETGIEDIRIAAGASPSSVYHQFDGLSALTIALLERTFARLFAHLAERVTPTRTAREAVTALVGAHLDWVFAHRDEARFMYQATALEFTPANRDALQLRKAELLAPVASHFSSFVAKGTLPAWSPLEFDVVLLGASHEACRRHLAGAPLRREWMRTTLPSLAWESLRAARREPAKPVRSRRATRSKGARG